MNIRDIEKLAGSVIIAGFDGTTLPAYVKSRLGSGALGGVVLFKRNVESPAQVADLLEQARSIAPSGSTPVTAVDQEGGRVVRIREPLTVLPPARKLGRMDNPAITQAAGRLVGMELNALGLNLNFAPVLDIDTNPDSPVIGDRSFGPTADRVIRHGLGFARGLRDAGVIPVAKHFPGHGDTRSDSHVSLPRVEHDRERLIEVEMEPFEAWARAGLGPVMVAHVLYEALDPKNPATVSRPIVKGELRDRIGFKGAVLSDDLEMGAVLDMGRPHEIAAEAIGAGVDGLLVCRSEEMLELVIQALVKEASRNPALQQQLTTASGRIGALSNAYNPKIRFDWLGSPEHLRLQREPSEQLTMEIA